MECTIQPSQGPAEYDTLDPQLIPSGVPTQEQVLPDRSQNFWEPAPHGLSIDVQTASVEPWISLSFGFG
jgi:hypothetical protein